MKKVIRLTESELIRVIKKIVKESEEIDGEEYMNHLIERGCSNIQAYYLAQLEISDNLNWKRMFEIYGEDIVNELFSNDYHNFLDLVFQINQYAEGKPLSFIYRRWDGSHQTMIDILTEYFFKGDKKLMIEKYGEYLNKGLRNQDFLSNVTTFIEHEIYKTYIKYKTNEGLFEEHLFENYLEYPDRYRNLFYTKDIGEIFYLYPAFNVDGVYDLIDILYH